jgi:hypothetical protein
MTAAQARRSAWRFGAAALLAWAAAFGLLPPYRGYLPSLALSATGMVLLCASLGLLVTRRHNGILLSSRNTYSLSRLQMVLWTILVLSALMAAAACRSWVAKDLGAALNIQIPNELLQVMGISYVSAAAAPAVLSLKSQTDATDGQIRAAAQRVGGPVTATGQMVGRPRGARALLRDLITGDDLGNAGIVDLSKLQQLLITLMLVFIYAGMLSQLFYGAPFAVATQTRLPPFSQDFVTLLLVSHGGYLAYKAVAKPTSDADETARPPPTPDRNAGLS